MAKFEFLRLSLSVPAIGPLASSSRAEPGESRQRFIEFVFRERADFFHRGGLFTYVPAPARLLPPGMFAGFIGRQIASLENSGPENLFALQPSKKWRAAFLAGNANPGAQFVAVEKRGDVGSAHAVIEQLIKNRLSSYRQLPWHIDLEYISETRAFREAAVRYRGQISELTFVFHPPNGLRGFDRFKEFDRIAQQQTNAENSKYSLENKNGAVIAEGDFVDSAAEYAAEGAGKIIMRDGRSIIFDSRSAKKIAEVPESLMPREGEDIKIMGAAMNLDSHLSKADKNDQD